MVLVFCSVMYTSCELYSPYSRSGHFHVWKIVLKNVHTNGTFVIFVHLIVVRLILRTNNSNCGN